MKAIHFALLIVISLLLLEYAEGNIHRAVHTRRRPKQEEASGFVARFYAKLKKSWLAIPASFLVGCTGIFPLLVIPVQSGKSLKEGSKLQLRMVLMVPNTWPSHHLTRSKFFVINMPDSNGRSSTEQPLCFSGYYHILNQGYKHSILLIC